MANDANNLKVLDQVFTGFKKAFWILLLPVSGFLFFFLIHILELSLSEYFVTRKEYEEDIKVLVETREKILLLEGYSYPRIPFNQPNELNNQTTKKNQNNRQ